MTVPILIYQAVISPWLPRRCIYLPTCSDYAQQVIMKHGVLRGLLLALGRITRCTSLFFTGGYDPPPDRFSAREIAKGYSRFRKRSERERLGEDDHYST